MDAYPQGTAELTWGISAQSSFKSAKAHFNKFLEGIGAERIQQLCGGHNLGGITYDTIAKEHVSWRLMDHFAGYLLKAKWICSKNPKDIAFYSADRYFSSIKIALLFALAKEDKQNPSLSDTVAMKKVRDGMVKGFLERAIRENKEVYTPHTTGTRESMLSVAMTSIWLGNEKGASMFAYFISLYLLAGRGVEVALVPFADVEMEHPSEFPEFKEKIPTVTLWRTKTHLRHALSMMPHRESMLEDWYFAIAYSMVMTL
jgi:hypothetical protein